jgi:hypothetical protein
MGGRRHRQTENQAELPSQSASVAGSGSLHIGRAQQPRLASLGPRLRTGLLGPELTAGISRVKGIKQLGFRSGNWLSAEQSSDVLKHACGGSMRANRDCEDVSHGLGCGFRRSELVGLELDEIQMRQGHWAAVD